jgi:hypothetical protein
MLDKTAVSAQLDAGATLADIAQNRNMPLRDVHAFAVEHNLSEQTLMQLDRCTRATLTRARWSAPHWERLIADDPECRVINGIDTRTTTGNINAQDILTHYHGAVRCFYTGEPTDMVMPADATPHNMLVSNLVPLTKEVMQERFQHVTPVIEDLPVTLTGPDGTVRVGITTDHKFDKLLGAGMNVRHVEQAIDLWVRPYIEHHSFEEILTCFDCPATSVLSALWVWRQLEKRALVKGLARVKVEIDSKPIAYVTKAAVLAQTQMMLQRQFGERVIATAQPAVMPPPGQGAQPARLIKL